MPTLEQLLSIYQSFFSYPDIAGSSLALGIILAIIFGLIWLACYKPPYRNIIKKHWLWIVLIISPFFTLAAFTFIQVPLQSRWGFEAIQTWGDETLKSLLLISIIPAAVISGLVVEGAKMVPAVIYWFANHRKISLKTGLLIGAAAGAGFGVLETQHVFNTVFIQGWDIDIIQSYGLFAYISLFWERFFITALHVAVCALAGYGLAKGKGWQFYLLASILHAIMEYILIIIKAQIIEFEGGEVLIALWAAIITAAALWIRFTKAK